MNGAEVVNLIGIPSILGIVLYTGRKLSALDRLEKDIEDIVKPDLKDVRERFATLEGKTANLFAQKSPISLTQKGQKILKQSGIKEYIDNNQDILLPECHNAGNMETPYDIQQSVFDMFDNYEFPQKTDNQLKSYAFDNGLSMDMIRRVGAIYFRDLCLVVRGFKASDLDKK